MEMQLKIHGITRYGRKPGLEIVIGLSDERASHGRRGVLTSTRPVYGRKDLLVASPPSSRRVRGSDYEARSIRTEAQMNFGMEATRNLDGNERIAAPGVPKCFRSCT